MTLEEDVELENLRKKRLEKLREQYAAEPQPDHLKQAGQTGPAQIPRYSLEHVINMGLSGIRTTSAEEFPALAAAFVLYRSVLIKNYPRKYGEILEITYHRYLTHEAKGRLDNLNQIDPEAVLFFKDDLLKAVAQGIITKPLTDGETKSYLQKTDEIMKKRRYSGKV